MKLLELLAYSVALVFGFLMLGLGLLAFCGIFWWEKGRNGRLRIPDRIRIFRRRSLPCIPAAEEERSVKSVIVEVEQGGISDCKEVEVAKAFGREEDEEEEEEEEDYIDAGLIGLEPRFLFTIIEESREDLDSDGRSSRGEWSKRLSISRSFSDLGSRSNHLIESSSSSPPPTFKFLRDAEEKFHRRLRLETEEKSLRRSLSPHFVLPTKDDLGLKILEKRKENDILSQVKQLPSSSSKILPLASSPTC